MWTVTKTIQRWSFWIHFEGHGGNLIAFAPPDKVELVISVDLDHGKLKTEVEKWILN
jgi:hypothetical protein